MVLELFFQVVEFCFLLMHLVFQLTLLFPIFFFLAAGLLNPVFVVGESFLLFSNHFYLALHFLSESLETLQL